MGRKAQAKLWKTQDRHEAANQATYSRSEHVRTSDLTVHTSYRQDGPPPSFALAYYPLSLYSLSTSILQSNCHNYITTASRKTSDISTLLLINLTASPNMPRREQTFPMVNLPPRKSNADKFFDNLKGLAFSDPKDVKECYIFLEEDNDPTVTLRTCKHRLHLHCIRLSIESTCRNHNRCPVCRTVMFDDTLPLAETGRRWWTLETAQLFHRAAGTPPLPTRCQPLLHLFPNRDGTMQLALVNHMNAHAQARVAPVAGRSGQAHFQQSLLVGNRPSRFGYPSVIHALFPGSQPSSLYRHSDHSVVQN
jgi:hypothetical protein